MERTLEVLIAGGGVAGMETALALDALAPGQTRVTVLSPDPEFEFRPLSVEEPFTGQPAERRDLRGALDPIGGRYVDGALTEVDPESHQVKFGFDGTLDYGVLVVCIGARARPAYEGPETFWSNRSDIPVDEMIGRAHSSERGTLSLVVPPGTSWPLPLYEIALLVRRRSEELGLSDVGIELLTPEDAALGIFGERPSAAVAELLEARRIELHPGTSVTQTPAGDLDVSGRAEPLDPALVLALPELRGPRVAGLPADEGGYLPIDGHGVVAGVPDVYAAGDGTTFPVKQGGIATQQADAVAEHIAQRLGAIPEARPFRPVLRGQLLTGSDSLNMRHEVGDESAGEAGADYLWWPPQKVAGRYLAAWLGHADASDMGTPDRALDVEVSVPHEWHSEPL